VIKGRIAPSSAASWRSSAGREGARFRPQISRTHLLRDDVLTGQQTAAKGTKLPLALRVEEQLCAKPGKPSVAAQVMSDGVTGFETTLNQFR